MTDNEYRIGHFESSYEVLEKLIYKSWSADSHRSAIFTEYSSDWLKWNFSSPLQDRDLLVGAYDEKDDLVGFLCAMNRRAIFNNKKESDLLIGTLLTVHPEHRRKRIAWRMVEKMKTLVLDKGYDVFSGYLYTKRASAPLMDKVILKYKKPLGLDVRTIAKVKFLVRPLNYENIKEAKGISFLQKMLLKKNSSIPSDSDNENTRLASGGDVRELCELFNNRSRKIDLARYWTHEEMRSFFQHGSVSWTYVYIKRGAIVGAVNCFKTNVTMYGDSYPVVEIDNLVLPEDEGDSIKLFYSVLSDLRKRGHDVATIGTNQGYLDILKKVGFISFPRTILFIGHGFNKDITLEGISTSNIDIR